MVDIVVVAVPCIIIGVVVGMVEGAAIAAHIWKRAVSEINASWGDTYSQMVESYKMIFDEYCRDNG